VKAAKSAKATPAKKAGRKSAGPTPTGPARSEPPHGTPEPPAADRPHPSSEPQATVVTPQPASEPQAAAGTPPPTPERGAIAETSQRGPERQATAETPQPAPEPQATAETAQPVPEPQATAETPQPAPEPQATVQAPQPASEPRPVPDPRAEGAAAEATGLEDVPLEPVVADGDPAPADDAAGEPTGDVAVETGSVETGSVETGSVETGSAEAGTDGWARLVADPGHTPELLALAAVRVVGPRAGEWVARIREQYPAATADGVARLAVRQFVRFGGVGGALAAHAGAYAPVALIGAAAFTQAQLILHVAAAYGRDPADPARAADLLILTRVHPSRDDAEAALAVAGEPGHGVAGVVADAAWRLGRMAAVQSGGWWGLRLVDRFFPGTGFLAATLTARSSAEYLGTRAMTYYRGGVSRGPAS
jgi:hypothetical protein